MQMWIVSLQWKNETIRGYGNGFTTFIGLSKINSIWIADLIEQSKSLLEEEVNFSEGDCLIVKYDTLHARAANNMGYGTFKPFFTCMYAQAASK